MKKQLLQYYGWIAGTLIFSIVAQIIFPFPIGLIVALGIFIVLPLLIKRVMGKKLRDSGYFTGFNDSKMQKTCLVCGNKSNGKVQCSRCGSKQFSFK